MYQFSRIPISGFSLTTHSPRPYDARFEGDFAGMRTKPLSFPQEKGYKKCLGRVSVAARSELLVR